MSLQAYRIGKCFQITFTLDYFLKIEGRMHYVLVQEHKLCGKAVYLPAISHGLTITTMNSVGTFPAG